MLMPSIFGENLFDDDWMNFPFNDEFWGKKNPLYGKHAQNMMKTDIREDKDNYVIDIDLPGFDKKNIKIDVTDGYLTINAKVNNEDNEKKGGKYIRKERYYGECSRSFYVGDDVKPEDINANFKNGILTLEVPKVENKGKLPEKKYIEIKD